MSRTLSALFQLCQFVFVQIGRNYDAFALSCIRQGQGFTASTRARIPDFVATLNVHGGTDTLAGLILYFDQAFFKGAGLAQAKASGGAQARGVDGRFDTFVFQ